MSIKYQCPLCDEIYDDEDEAVDCRNECAETEYRVIEIDTFEDAKADPEKFVGKCETCRHTDDEGRTFADCPRSGLRDPSDGCEAYTPDVQTFGTIIETLWNEQQEARP